MSNLNSIETNPIQPPLVPNSEIIMEQEELKKEKRRENNDEILNAIYNHLNQYFRFFHSKYSIKMEQDESFGFSADEKKEIIIIADQVEKMLNKIFAENKIDIINNNHFSHFVGNGATTVSNRWASRFEEKKNIPPEAVPIMKKELQDLNYYFQEAANDQGLLEEELTLLEGHLTFFIGKYLKNNLPDGSKQIALFRFFRDLELGRIEADDFSQKVKTWANCLDIEKLKGDLTEYAGYTVFKTTNSETIN